MTHFTELSDVPCCKWMPKMAFFHLLSATGGHPRALQLLLEEFFGRRLEKCKAFVDEVDSIDMNVDHIFTRVADRFDLLHGITTFAERHKEVVRALIRLCILQKPSGRTHAPSDQFRHFTLEVLERDNHTILEASEEFPGKVFVRISYFVFYHYNIIINGVQDCFGSAFLKDWKQDHEWRFFERVIAEHEALRTCLLIDGGSEETTLGEIYQGTFGRTKTLGLTVKLRRLKVANTGQQFQEMRGLEIRGQDLDWKSDVVIRNVDGAQVGDAYVYREGADGNDDNILCALQANKLRSPVSASLLSLEHNKNIDAIRRIPEGSTLDNQGTKRVSIITVVITTADIADPALQQLDETFPEGCLLIHRGNFTRFFGDVFGIYAALSMTKDLNWNFATQESLKRKFEFDAEEADQIIKNMPYRSYDDLIRKVPAMSSKGLDKDIGFLPYQDFQPEKRRRLADSEDKEKDEVEMWPESGPEPEPEPEPESVLGNNQ
ncbi:hypothetical protein BGZ50_008307, partial [Haplosporangium sp. Z 11]